MPLHAPKSTRFCPPPPPPSPRSELNFPVGAKFDLDFSPHRWNFPVFLFDILLCADRCALDPSLQDADVHATIPLAKDSEVITALVRTLAKALRTGYDRRALQQVPHLVLLDADFYEEVLRPILADIAVCWLEQQHFDPAVLGGRALREVLDNKFLVADRCAEGITNGVGGVDAAKVRKYAKLLNMCTDWLDAFASHALQKIDRVTFGIMTKEDKDRAMAWDPAMPRTRWKLAIPFVSKDVPSRSSEFAHPDVVIALTFLAYRYSGLRYEDFTEIIAEVCAQLAKEVGPMRDRRANKLYEEWVENCGMKIRGKGDEDNADGTAAAEYRDDEVVPLKLLKQSDEEQMQRLYKVLRKSTRVVDYYLKEMIFPTFLRYQQVKNLWWWMLFAVVVVVVLASAAAACCCWCWRWFC